MRYQISFAKGVHHDLFGIGFHLYPDYIKEIKKAPSALLSYMSTWEILREKCGEALAESECGEALLECT